MIRHLHTALSRVLLIGPHARSAMRLKPSPFVAVVNYHDPAPATLSSHIERLRQHFRLVCMNTIGRLVRGELEVGTEPCIAITIDDGHVGNIDLAPVIRTYGVPVTIYVCSGLIDTRREFWFQRADAQFVNTARRLPDAVRRRAMQDRYGHHDETEYDRRSALSAKMVRTLMAAGATFGAHTVFHPFLDQCTDAVARQEIMDSKRGLEAITGGAVEHFAYPGGAYSERVATLAQSAGFSTARTIEPRSIEMGTHPYMLPCFGISDSAHPTKALAQAVGAWSRLKMALSRNTLAS